MARTSSNMLPPDVLAIIFQYVANADTPRRLLPVCRRFYNIVINSPALWANLLYTDSFSLSSMKTDARVSEKQLGRKSICTTLASLARAIQRTKHHPFELTIVLFGLPSADEDRDIHLIDPAWFAKKCRALRIRWDYIRPTLLNRLNELQVLEELDIEVWHEFTEPMASLVNSVAQTSFNLRHLKIRSQSQKVDLRNYPELISRLMSLDVDLGHVADFETTVSNAVSLHHLSITQTHSYQDQISPISGPLLVRDLSMYGAHPRVAANLYEGLTHLRLHYTHYNQSHLFQLPQLTHLVLSGSWNPITQMQAPQLRNVTLRDGYYRQSDQLRLISCKEMRPICLEMDVTPENEDLRFLFSDTWDDLEQVQITYVSDGQGFYELLSNFLSGTKKRRPVCPRLWRLEIIAPIPSSGQQMAQTKTRLKQIIDGRRSGGVLKRVRLGWYPAFKGTLYSDLTLSSEDLVDDGEISWVDMYR